MKKLLLIIVLLFSTFSFAQQNEKDNMVIKKNEPQATLSSISAYPNPFNVATKINFQSKIIQQIEFTVKNLLGKTVYIEQINSEIGYNAILFNRDNLIKGMYIYTLQTDNEVVSKRIVIR